MKRDNRIKYISVQVHTDEEEQGEVPPHVKLKGSEDARQRQHQRSEGQPGAAVTQHGKVERVPGENDHGVGSPEGEEDRVALDEFDELSSGETAADRARTRREAVVDGHDNRNDDRAGQVGEHALQVEVQEKSVPGQEFLSGVNGRISTTELEQRVLQLEIAPGRHSRVPEYAPRSVEDQEGPELEHVPKFDEGQADEKVDEFLFVCVCERA